jgi:hypothetical protein
MDFPRPVQFSSRLVALVIGSLLSVVALRAVLVAFGVVPAVAGPFALGIQLCAAALIYVRGPSDLARIRPNQRILFALWTLLSLAAIYRVGALSIFMADPARDEFAHQKPLRELDDPDLLPPTGLMHYCGTAYLLAARLADEDLPNIYDHEHYKQETESELATEYKSIGFKLDIYQYPPTFLLGPWVLIKAGFDFIQVRSLWFAWSLLVYLAATALITAWITGWRFSALWFVWPALLVTPNAVRTLQTGNVHAFVMLLAVMGMVLIAMRRNVAGGLCLAYAITAKLFPGVLLLYLMASRRWSAVMWTAGAMAVMTLLTVWAIGLTPFLAFFEHQVPSIQDASAFSFAFENPRAMLGNMAVRAIPYKLQSLGLGQSWDVATIGAWVNRTYGVLLLILTIVVGRRLSRGSPGEVLPDRRLPMVRIAAALLVLAQLASPFSPAVYANLPFLLLIILWIPAEHPSWARIALLALGMLVFSFNTPLPVGPPSAAFDSVYTLCAVMAIASLAIWTVLAMSRVAGRPGVVEESVA